MVKLERAGAETFEYFEDKNGLLYSRDSNGYWQWKLFGVWQRVVHYEALEAAYQELELKLQ